MRKYTSNFVNIKTFNNFQYYSDIHLEFGLKQIPVKASNLILAGDIGNPFKYYYKDFLTKCSYSYENIYLVAGNHEYWHNNIEETNDQLENICEKLKNVHFLNRKSVKYNEYTILGCTLWTNIKSRDNKIGDDLYIKDFSIDKLNELHNMDLQWLETNLKLENNKVIVITHHVPTYKLLYGKYDNKHYSKYYDRFYNNLDYLIKEPVNIWICGHSHCQMEVDINNVELKINAIGYKN